MPESQRSRRRLTIRSWTGRIEDEEHPRALLSSSHPRVTRRTPKWSDRRAHQHSPSPALVVLGAGNAVVRGHEQRESDSSSRGSGGGSVDRAHVDAARAGRRDPDRLRARAQSHGIRNTSAFGRHLGPGSRWAGRRAGRIATRSGRPRSQARRPPSGSQCRRSAIRVDIVSPFMNGSQIVPHVDRRSDLSRTALANDAHGN